MSRRKPKKTDKPPKSVADLEYMLEKLKLETGGEVGWLLLVGLWRLA